MTTLVLKMKILGVGVFLCDGLEYEVRQLPVKTDTE
jgi:hypothetical protein